jgi:two-component system invasion response regulator UvrY
MDLKMPGMGGIEACKQIIAISPDVNIVILTSIYDVPSIIQTLKVGVAGYVVLMAIQIRVKMVLRYTTYL